MERRFLEQNAENPEHAKRIEMMGTIFEAIVYSSDQYGWFGDDAVMILPSRFDDIVNGVDGIIEMQEGPGSASHVALAIDLTTSENLGEKFRKIKKEIDENKLAEVRYFVSEHINIKGHKSKIPRLIIGADHQNLGEMINLWIEKKNKQLSEHHTQIIVLLEMKMQLETFRDYAQKTGKDEIAKILEHSLVQVNEIINSKEIDLEEETQNCREDKVFSAIETYLSGLRQITGM